MNVLDIFLSIALVYGLFRGIKNGFFVELASLVSMLLGIFIAIKFSYLMQDWLVEKHQFENPKLIQVVAFALTFILVVVGVSLLAKVFTSIANFASLGIFNKILGGIFGVLKTILTISILLNLFQKININNALLSEETQKDSVLFQPVRDISQALYPSIEEWFVVFKEESFELEKPDKK